MDSGPDRRDKGLHDGQELHCRARPMRFPRRAYRRLHGKSEVASKSLRDGCCQGARIEVLACTGIQSPREPLVPNIQPETLGRCAPFQILAKGEPQSPERGLEIDKR